jgi:hypothetical protein
MYPAAVALVGRVVAVGVVVEYANLIAEVNERDATYSQDNSVNQQNAVDGKFNLILAFFFERFFQTSERRACPADAAIARFGIFLKGQSARETSGETSAVKLIEEVTVVMTIDSQQRCIFV